MKSETHANNTVPGGSLWLKLISVLGLIKLIVYIYDPNPQVFLGDSMSYLATATNGWIPPDRSFFYGFVIHFVTTKSRSLSSLVTVQSIAGLVTALLTAVILVRFFRTPRKIAVAAAVAMALDPLQLLYERFVLTESLSTMLFAVFLLLMLEYVWRKRPWTLIAAQAVGVTMVAFRVTFMPMLLVATTIAPFVVYIAADRGARRRELVRLGAHLSISLFFFYGMQEAYKSWNGSLSRLPPAYSYADGYFLISNVSPLVTAADTDNLELVPVLSRPLVYATAADNFNARNAEMFAPDGLVERIKGVVKDSYRANLEAKSIAYRAIRRDPIGFARIAFRTYQKFFSKEYMATLLRGEAGDSGLNPNELKALSFYHLDGAGLPFMKTVTRRYHSSMWPFYILMVHTPLILLTCTFIARREERKFLWLLMLIATVHVTVVQALGVEPSPRHLHAVTVLLWLAAGLLAARIASKIYPSEGSLTNQDGSSNNRR